MPELTVIVANLSDKPVGGFLGKKEFEPFMNNLNIKDVFSNYLMVDSLGRLSSIKEEVYIGPMPVNTTAVSKVYETNLYLTDFIQELSDPKLELDKTVLLLDSRIKTRYLEALDEENIGYRLHTPKPIYL